MKKKLIYFICILAVTILMNGCKKATLPEVVTADISELSLTTAVSGGEITSDGDDEITAKGVCWNTTGSPTISDSKTIDGKGSENFVSSISGLQAGTVYYLCAYATNSVGTAYGESITFSTKIADVDGNQYFTILIGSQIWMAENLKTTKYNDNAQIPLVTGNTAWSTLTTHGYCWYMNDATAYKSLYGAIYNWFAVNSGKLCPTGWHVPTDVEYITLETTLGLPVAQSTQWEWRGTDQGKQMKKTTGWNQGENGTNTSGFSALPGGYRYYVDGNFAGVGLLGYWWTSSAADASTSYYRRLDGNNNGIYRASAPKSAGKSVRCIKN